MELDKPVTTYLPEFSMEDPRYTEITVRMLLNHSSGLAGTNMKTGFGTEKNRSYVMETLAELANGNLKHNPGDVSVYCNDGFTLAEAIIERVSGMSYADFLGMRVLDVYKRQARSDCSLQVLHKSQLQDLSLRVFVLQGDS